MKQITTKSYASRLRTYRTPRTRALRSTQNRSLGASGVGAFIREMAKFRDRGDVSQEQYQQLVMLVCGTYVGQEVEKRVGKVLEEALSPERLTRYLSLPQ